MKWITVAVAVAVALATNSCVKGQDFINFVLDQEDAKGIRGQQQLIKSSRSEFENEEVLADSTPSLLPRKTSIDKPESIGVLSNDRESVTIDPQDQDVVVLSVSQDAIDRQAQSQGRRLDVVENGGVSLM